MTRGRTSPCRECGRTVRWAMTDKGRAMPLEVDPDPAGNQATMLDVHGALRVRAVTEAFPIYPYEKPAMPHVAVCKGKQAPPLPSALPANVVPFRRRTPTRRR